MFFYDSASFKTKVRQALIKDLGSESSDEDPAKAFYRNQILDNFDKKYIESGASIDTKEVAIRTFLTVNARMKSINHAYSSNLTTWNTIPELHVARNFVRHVLGPAPTLEQVFRSTKHSTGSSLGVKFIDTSIEAKMTFPMSGTKACCRLWERYKHWDWDFYSQAVASQSHGVLPETIPVTESRTTTVPKSAKTDRLIAVEPTLNMFFQQAVMALMTKRLSTCGLSIERDPEKHRSLAFVASITGNLATVDFSSASDSVSLALCHFLLPKEWYSLLFMLRCHRTSIGGKVVDVHMMSSMGNATTFPLETLILYALAVGVQSYDPQKGHGFGYNTSNINVFGDDCILPTGRAGRFLEVCTSVGFQPNRKKTFLDGPFRESCGGDFYRGKDVRPWFLTGLTATRRPTDAEAYLYTMLNGVIRMYRKYFGTLTYVYDKALLRLLFREVRLTTKFVKFVPENFPEDAGICALSDIHRFIHNYSINPSRIGLSRHGQYEFSFLRYHIPARGVIHEGLRYRYGQKWHDRQPTEVQKENTPVSRPIRKRGFYVKATSISLVTTPCTMWGTDRAMSSSFFQPRSSRVQP